MVDELGCFDRVVGCNVSSDYPPGIEKGERLGYDLDPDLDLRRSKSGEKPQVCAFSRETVV